MDIPFTIFIIGLLLILSLLTQALLKSVGIPALTGWIILGTLLNAFNGRIPVINDHSRFFLDVFAQVGVIVLLFRIGMESKLRLLLNQLRKASLIWLVNVLLSGILGFACALLLGFDTVTAAITGVALTATSTGVSVSVWREQDKLNSGEGQLLVDLAEMDDITGILFLSLIFSVVPLIMHHDRGIAGALTTNIAMLSGKLILLGLICFLISRFLVQPLLRFTTGLRNSSTSTLMVAALGLLIAAVSGLLDLSVALGAFFAGLAFSFQPQAIKTETSFLAIHDMFLPFFFIGIGLNISLESISTALTAGIALFIAAILGKIAGTALPARLFLNTQGALLLGVSMVPRAEIATIIASRAHLMGEKIFPATAFSAIAIVVLLTCLLSPPAIRRLLKR